MLIDFWSKVSAIAVFSGLTAFGAANAGPCPPCNSTEVGTDACVLTCCYFQSCQFSGVGIGCVALCDLGFVLHKIFDDEEDGDRITPAFVTETSLVSDDQCEYAGRLGGIIDLSGVNDVQMLEVSGYDLSNDAFIGLNNEYIRVNFFLMPILLSDAGATLTEWTLLGAGRYDGERRSWTYDLRLGELDRSHDYLIRATFDQADRDPINAFAFGALSSATSAQ